MSRKKNQIMSFLQKRMIPSLKRLRCPKPAAAIAQPLNAALTATLPERAQMPQDKNCWIKN